MSKTAMENLHARSVDRGALLSIQEEALWRARKRGMEALPDGILDYDLYEQSPVRIMWILKQDREDCQDGYSYAERVRLAAKEGRIQSSPTWAPISYASYALLNGVCDYNLISDANSCATAMLSTAIVEIQKELGYPRTENEVVREGYKMYGDLLKRQIIAAAPDVVIVCLPEALRDIVMAIQQDALLCNKADWDWGYCAASACDSLLYLWAWHPSQTKITQEEYVMSIVKQYEAYKCTKFKDCVNC